MRSSNKAGWAVLAGLSASMFVYVIDTTLMNVSILEMDDLAPSSKP